jgi:BlaI family penicillinase repressor
MTKRILFTGLIAQMVQLACHAGNPYFGQEPQFYWPRPRLRCAVISRKSQKCADISQQPSTWRAFAALNRNLEIQARRGFHFALPCRRFAAVNTCSKKKTLAIPTIVGNKSYGCRKIMDKHARNSSVNPRKSKLPPISDAELVVMKVVWHQSPVTTNQVVAALETRTDWKPKTIHTLLSRLARKRALTFERRGREYLFRPLIAAADYAHAASRSFLHRLFDGEIAPFLACFLEREKLTREEIAELRRILEEKQP